MSPTLRSAQNTPSKKSTTETSPISSPPRKAPTCSKCRRSRIGHPRSGCPYVDEREETPFSAQPLETLVLASDELADGMRSLRLGTPVAKDRKPTATGRDRRRSSFPPQLQETLISLDLQERQDLDKLLDETAAEEAESNEERTAVWCKALVEASTPKKVKKTKDQGLGTGDNPQKKITNI